LENAMLISSPLIFLHSSHCSCISIFGTMCWKLQCIFISSQRIA
jgi:hypothetical protein